RVLLSQCTSTVFPSMMGCSREGGTWWGNQCLSRALIASTSLAPSKRMHSWLLATTLYERTRRPSEFKSGRQRSTSANANDRRHLRLQEHRGRRTRSAHRHHPEEDVTWVRSTSRKTATAPRGASGG